MVLIIKIKKILIANRGEIAIRVMRAAAELDIQTVAVYAHEDRFSLHRFKADESYLLGKGDTPVQAYLNIEKIITVAVTSGADAIHPGYGFLSESPDFAEACAEAGLIFIGPSPEVMRKLGNKIQARALAESSGVAVMPATTSLPNNEKEVAQMAEYVGYPLMLKASWGGGGRGMRVIDSAEDLHSIVQTGRREALAAFNNDEIYLEKLVKRARHVEVQILGDNHGNMVHLFERDCTVQRRNQKVVERAPAVYLTEEQRSDFCLAAIKVCKAVNYTCAGTVEFLQDVDTGAFYFIEVNPRIQVEHTVTESITGIDIVKAQIKISEGHLIGTLESGIPPQVEIKIHGHAIQCRVTAEDPENNFIPDYGTITTYRSPAGFGIRLDAGTAYTGAEITRYYDSLLVKVTAWAATEEEVALRMRRALLEFRIRGVNTNLAFLAELMTNKKFQKAEYTTRFIDETPELMELPRRRDRGTKLVNFIAEVIAKGNPAVAGRPWPSVIEEPVIPRCEGVAITPGSRQKFEELGATDFSKWILDQKQVLVTDTTFRDAHQSLLATRFRSHDLLQVCDAYARLVPQLLSVECWGGATFDVAMRFLNECPWTRLKAIKAKIPNVLTQMLLRASNGVGYKNYPDNVVNYFVSQAAKSGVDIFRVFDSLNWVENMRLPIDAVIASGKICEATICYTGNLVGASEKKYNLSYYVKMAKELEAAGAHVLGIKDMAGLCLPRAATLLVSELKQEIGIPIHFHTHDTSGIAGATVLAAIDAGVDAVDLAMDSMSGMTSQPNMGSVLEALRNGPRESDLDANAIRTLSDYWAGVRRNYLAFESQERTGASEVYVHGMPGGQFTNLREQARSLGLGRRWPEVAKAYSDVNEMFGDIVKVTPSSKVVGDMALMMVSSGLSRADVESASLEVAFPDSVVSFFRGDLGQPLGGFPASLRAKVLQGEVGLEVRPGSVLAPADLVKERGIAEQRASRQISDEEFASYLMYPDVFIEYVASYRKHSDLTILPTTIFFYGMESGQEVQLQIESRRSIVLRYMGMSEVDQEGCQTVYFELNGQPRQVRIRTAEGETAKVANPKSDTGNTCHVGCPMPGLVAQIDIEKGGEVSKGQSLFTIEAMKMQTTIRAERDGTIKEIVVSEGQQVDSGDLLAVFE
jgi:pyruvate carboxylase